MTMRGVLVAISAAGAGLVTALYAKRRMGSPLGPSTYFWASWLLLIGSGLVAESTGLMPAIPERSWDLVGEGFVGAFLGGLVGVRFCPRAGARPEQGGSGELFLRQCDWLGQILARPFILVSVVIGLFNFVHAWQPVGFDPYRLLEVREKFVNELDHGWTFRATSYLSLLGTFLFMIFGAADAGRRVRAGRLSLIWLSSVPSGLAIAARGWTLAPLVVYGFSFLIARRLTARRRRLHEFVPFLGLVAAGLWMFIVIGSVRNLEIDSARAESLEVSNWESEQSLMAAGWLGSSMLSVGVHGEFVEGLAPSYGEATFAYLSLKARQLGLLPLSRVTAWESWRLEVLPFEAEYGSTWCIPATAIPYLILDYGRALMPVALGLFLAVAQWIGTQWAGRGIFRHTAAFLATYATFLTIQELNVFNSTNVAVLFWAAVVAFGARLASYRTRRQAPVPA
jgi:hypothetical protein